MTPRSPLWRALRYLPAVPRAIARILAELVRDVVLLFLGRRRLVRWPEPSAATTL